MPVTHWDLEQIDRYMEEMRQQRLAAAPSAPAPTAEGEKTVPLLASSEPPMRERAKKAKPWEPSLGERIGMGALSAVGPVGGFIAAGLGLGPSPEQVSKIARKTTEAVLGPSPTTVPPKPETLQPPKEPESKLKRAVKQALPSLMGPLAGTVVRTAIEDEGVNRLSRTARIGAGIAAALAEKGIEFQQPEMAAVLVPIALLNAFGGKLASAGKLKAARLVKLTDAIISGKFSYDMLKSAGIEIPGIEQAIKENDEFGIGEALGRAAVDLAFSYGMAKHFKRAASEAWRGVKLPEQPSATPGEEPKQERFGRIKEDLKPEDIPEELYSRAAKPFKVTREQFAEDLRGRDISGLTERLNELSKDVERLAELAQEEPILANSVKKNAELLDRVRRRIKEVEYGPEPPPAEEVSKRKRAKKAKGEEAEDLDLPQTLEALKELESKLSERADFLRDKLSAVSRELRQLKLKNPEGRAGALRMAILEADEVIRRARAGAAGATAESRTGKPPREAPTAGLGAPGEEPVPPPAARARRAAAGETARPAQYPPPYRPPERVSGAVVPPPPQIPAAEGTPTEPPPTQWVGQTVGGAAILGESAKMEEEGALLSPELMDAALEFVSNAKGPFTISALSEALGIPLNLAVSAVRLLEASGVVAPKNPDITLTRGAEITRESLRKLIDEPFEVKQRGAFTTRLIQEKTEGPAGSAEVGGAVLRSEFYEPPPDTTGYRRNPALRQQAVDIIRRQMEAARRRPTGRRKSPPSTPPESAPPAPTAPMPPPLPPPAAPSSAAAPTTETAQRPTPKRRAAARAAGLVAPPAPPPPPAPQPAPPQAPVTATPTPETIVRPEPPAERPVPTETTAGDEAYHAQKYQEILGRIAALDDRISQSRDPYERETLRLQASALGRELQRYQEKAYSYFAKQRQALLGETGATEPEAETQRAEPVAPTTEPERAPAPAGEAQAEPVPAESRETSPTEPEVRKPATGKELKLADLAKRGGGLKKKFGGRVFVRDAYGDVYAITDIKRSGKRQPTFRVTIEGQKEPAVMDGGLAIEIIPESEARPLLRQQKVKKAESRVKRVKDDLRVAKLKGQAEEVSALEEELARAQEEVERARSDVSRTTTEQPPSPATETQPELVSPGRTKLGYAIFPYETRRFPLPPPARQITAPPGPEKRFPPAGMSPFRAPQQTPAERPEPAIIAPAREPLEPGPAPGALIVPQAPERPGEPSGLQPRPVMVPTEAEGTPARPIKVGREFRERYLDNTVEMAQSAPENLAVSPAWIGSEIVPISKLEAMPQVIRIEEDLNAEKKLVPGNISFAVRQQAEALKKAAAFDEPIRLMLDPEERLAIHPEDVTKVLAAKELGIEDIPVRIVHVPAGTIDPADARQVFPRVLKPTRFSDIGFDPAEPAGSLEVHIPQKILRNLRDAWLEKVAYKDLAKGQEVVPKGAITIKQGLPEGTVEEAKPIYSQYGPIQVDLRPVRVVPARKGQPYDSLRVPVVVSIPGGETLAVSEFEVARVKRGRGKKYAGMQLGEDKPETVKTLWFRDRGGRIRAIRLQGEPGDTPQRRAPLAGAARVEPDAEGKGEVSISLEDIEPEATPPPEQTRVILEPGEKLVAISKDSGFEPGTVVEYAGEDEAGLLTFRTSGGTEKTILIPKSKVFNHFRIETATADEAKLGRKADIIFRRRRTVGAEAETGFKPGDKLLVSGKTKMVREGSGVTYIGADSDGSVFVRDAEGNERVLSPEEAKHLKKLPEPQRGSAIAFAPQSEIKRLQSIRPPLPGWSVRVAERMTKPHVALVEESFNAAKKAAAELNRKQVDEIRRRAGLQRFYLDRTADGEWAVAFDDPKTGQKEIVSTHVRKSSAAEEVNYRNKGKILDLYKEFGFEGYRPAKLPDGRWAVVRDDPAIAESAIDREFLITLRERFSPERFIAEELSGHRPKNIEYLYHPASDLVADIIEWADKGNAYPVRLQILARDGTILDEATIRNPVDAPFVFPTAVAKIAKLLDRASQVRAVPISGQALPVIRPLDSVKAAVNQEVEAVEQATGKRSKKRTAGRPRKGERGAAMVGMMLNLVLLGLPVMVMGAFEGGARGASWIIKRLAERRERIRRYRMRVAFNSEFEPQSLPESPFRIAHRPPDRDVAAVARDAAARASEHAKSTGRPVLIDLQGDSLQVLTEQPDGSVAVSFEATVPQGLRPQLEAELSSMLPAEEAGKIKYARDGQLMSVPQLIQQSESPAFEPIGPLEKVGQVFPALSNKSLLRSDFTRVLLKPLAEHERRLRNELEYIEGVIFAYDHLPPPAKKFLPPDYRKNLEAERMAVERQIENARLQREITEKDVLYHATTAEGFSGIMKSGVILPSQNPLQTGVSMSRVPVIRPKEMAIVLVLDRAKIPPARPIAEPGWEKVNLTPERSVVPGVRTSNEFIEEVEEALILSYAKDRKRAKRALSNFKKAYESGDPDEVFDANRELDEVRKESFARAAKRFVAAILRHERPAYAAGITVEYELNPESRVSRIVKEISKYLAAARYSPRGIGTDNPAYDVILDMLPKKDRQKIASRYKPGKIVSSSILIDELPHKITDLLDSEGYISTFAEERKVRDALQRHLRRVLGGDSSTMTKEQYDRLFEPDEPELKQYAEGLKRVKRYIPHEAIFTAREKLSPDFEYEIRTMGGGVPASAIKEILINRSAAEAYEVEAPADTQAARDKAFAQWLERIRRRLKKRGLNVSIKVFDNWRQLFRYQAERARERAPEAGLNRKRGNARREQATAKRLLGEQGQPLPPPAAAGSNVFYA